MGVEPGTRPREAELVTAAAERLKAEELPGSVVPVQLALKSDLWIGASIGVLRLSGDADGSTLSWSAYF